jgi:hypothetical protein
MTGTFTFSRISCSSTNEPGERLLGWGQEGRTVAAGLETRRNDHIDSRVFEDKGLVEGGSGPHQGNAPAAARLQNIGGRGPEHKAEYLGPDVEYHLDLVLEPGFERGRLGWQLNARLVKVRLELRLHPFVLRVADGAVYRVGVRYPQVEVVGLVGGCPDPLIHLVNFLRAQAVCPVPTQAAQVRHGCRQFDRRQVAAERPLQDRVPDAQQLGCFGVVPHGSVV